MAFAAVDGTGQAFELGLAAGELLWAFNRNEDGEVTRKCAGANNGVGVVAPLGSDRAIAEASHNGIEGY